LSNHKAAFKGAFKYRFQQMPISGWALASGVSGNKAIWLLRMSLMCKVLIIWLNLI